MTFADTQARHHQRTGQLNRAMHTLPGVVVISLFAAIALGL